MSWVARIAVVVVFSVSDFGAGQAFGTRGPFVARVRSAGRSLRVSREFISKVAFTAVVGLCTASQVFANPAGVVTALVVFFTLPRTARSVVNVIARVALAAVVVFFAQRDLSKACFASCARQNCLARVLHAIITNQLMSGVACFAVVVLLH